MDMDKGWWIGAPFSACWASSSMDGLFGLNAFIDFSFDPAAQLQLPSDASLIVKAFIVWQHHE